MQNQDVKKESGDTALMRAVFKGDAAEVAHLLDEEKHQKSINQALDSGLNALGIAFKFHSSSTIIALLEANGAVIPGVSLSEGMTFSQHYEERALAFGRARTLSDEKGNAAKRLLSRARKEEDIKASELTVNFQRAYHNSSETGVLRAVIDACAQQAEHENQGVKPLQIWICSEMSFNLFLLHHIDAWGVYQRSDNRVYINAGKEVKQSEKNPIKQDSVLAHELTHYLMEQVFRNSAKTFLKNEKKTQQACQAMLAASGTHCEQLKLSPSLAKRFLKAEVKLNKLNAKNDERLQGMSLTSTVTEQQIVDKYLVCEQIKAFKQKEWRAYQQALKIMRAFHQCSQEAKEAEWVSHYVEVYAAIGDEYATRFFEAAYPEMLKHFNEFVLPKIHELQREYKKSQGVEDVAHVTERSSLLEKKQTDSSSAYPAAPINFLERNTLRVAAVASTVFAGAAHLACVAVFSEYAALMCTILKVSLGVSCGAGLAGLAVFAGLVVAALVLGVLGYCAKKLIDRAKPHLSNLFSNTAFEDANNIQPCFANGRIQVPAK